MYFGHIHCHKSSKPFPFLTHPTLHPLLFVCLFHKTYETQLEHPYTLGCGVMHTPGAMPLKKTDSSAPGRCLLSASPQVGAGRHCASLLSESLSVQSPQKAPLTHFSSLQSQTALPFPSVSFMDSLIFRPTQVYSSSSPLQYNFR